MVVDDLVIALEVVLQASRRLHKKGVEEVAVGDRVRAVTIPAALRNDRGGYFWAKNIYDRL